MADTNTNDDTDDEQAHKFRESTPEDKRETMEKEAGVFASKRLPKGVAKETEKSGPKLADDLPEDRKKTREIERDVFGSPQGYPEQSHELTKDLAAAGEESAVRKQAGLDKRETEKSEFIQALEKDGAPEWALLLAEQVEQNAATLAELTEEEKVKYHEVFGP